MKLQKSKGQMTITIPKDFVVKGGFDQVDYAVVSQKQKGALIIRKAVISGEKKRQLQKGIC